MDCDCCSIWQVWTAILFGSYTFLSCKVKLKHEDGIMYQLQIWENWSSNHLGIRCIGPVLEVPKYQ